MRASALSDHVEAVLREDVVYPRVVREAHSLPALSVVCLQEYALHIVDDARELPQDRVEAAFAIDLHLHGERGFQGGSTLG